MGLRILGALIAAALIAWVVYRERKKLLRRRDTLLAVLVIAALSLAALRPGWFDPALSLIGFHPGHDRRLLGLLVLGVFFLSLLAVGGWSRLTQLNLGLSDLVDSLALSQLREGDGDFLRARCVVIIPAYNEAQTLPQLLAEMPPQVMGLTVRVLVVADGCTDETERVAKSLGASVLSPKLRRGQGAAIRLGYRAALAGSPEVLVTMDADGQHDPREMQRLVEPIVTRTADVVQGSRVLGSFEVESHTRRLGLTFFARVLSALARARITDPANGYRSISPKALQKLELTQDQFIASELILECAHRGLVVVEVPISVRRRAGGLTKKGTTFRYALGYSRAIVHTYLRHASSGGYEQGQPRWLAQSNASSGPVD
jgi:Glycosyl transferase family 2/Uncharacterized conserved protein (DUF2304)